MMWQDSAACATADHRLFLANTIHQAGPALAICAGCPVARRCMTFRPHGVDGVWGGHVYAVGGKRRKPQPAPTGDACGTCGSYAATGIPGCPGRQCKTRRAVYDRARYQARRSA